MTAERAPAPAASKGFLDKVKERLSQTSAQRKAQRVVARLMKMQPGLVELPSGFTTWALEELPLISEDRLVLVQTHLDALGELLKVLPKLEAQLAQRTQAEEKAQATFKAAPQGTREKLRAEWESARLKRQDTQGRFKREQVNAHKHLGLMVLVNRFVRSHSPISPQ